MSRVSWFAFCEQAKVAVVPLIANAISYLITTMKQANSKRFDEDFSIAYLESVVAPVSAIIDRIRTNQQRSLDDPM
jgi:hypothetical protein